MIAGFLIGATIGSIVTLLVLIWWASRSGKGGSRA